MEPGCASTSSFGTFNVKLERWLLQHKLFSEDLSLRMLCLPQRPGEASTYQKGHEMQSRLQYYVRSVELSAVGL